jgi:ribonuclease HIII
MAKGTSGSRVEVVAAEKKAALLRAGFRVREGRPLPYGVQFLASRGESEIPVNVYHSKKKGTSVVVGGRKDAASRRELEIALGVGDRLDLDVAGGKRAAEGEFARWVGTDESGKGDFFGPLVIAGFAADEKTGAVLKELGVADCKTLADARVLALSRQIHAAYPDRVKTVLLLPKTYNAMYREFLTEKKKLNEILAWGHARIIADFAKADAIDGAVVDRFARDERTLLRSLRGLASVPVVQRERAEDNIAVAAASVVARALFLSELRKLSDRFDMDLPPGAGEPTIAAAKRFVERYGKEKLEEVAKTHFRTMESLG